MFPCRPGSQKDTRRKATSEAERQHHTREEGATRLRTTTTTDTRRDRAGRSQSPAPIVGVGVLRPGRAAPEPSRQTPPESRRTVSTGTDTRIGGSGGRNRDPAQSETGNRNRDTRCPANGNRDYRSGGWGVSAAPLNRPSGPRADGAGRRRTTRRDDGDDDVGG